MHVRPATATGVNAARERDVEDSSPDGNPGEFWVLERNKKASVSFVFESENQQSVKSLYAQTESIDL